jgi:putative ubiquitin-RnfH superfamily antitoxin RatB of RatAB toxin-antitoxin module
MAPNDDIFFVEVVYATPLAQSVKRVFTKKGESIQSVIIASGLLDDYPQIDLTQQRVGVFGQEKQLTDLVQAGDRIELYRPLLISPRQARLLRVQKKNRKS